MRSPIVLSRVPALLLALACLAPMAKLHAAQPLDEAMAIAKVEAFFDALDIETYASERFMAELAPGFFIFEMGERFDAASFDAFITEAAKTIVETDWTFSDFEVELGHDLAHVAYLNHGRFVDAEGHLIYSEWMESVLVVRAEADWKIKFLQSDLLSRWIIAPNGTRTDVYPVTAGEGAADTTAHTASDSG